MAILTMAVPTMARTYYAQIAARSMGGGHIVPPYDDPDVISGQGTIGLEIMDEIADLDAVLVHLLLTYLALLTMARDYG